MTAAPTQSTTVRTSSAAKENLSPAMRQHARFKAQHPDCLLLFRMGDFYELFGEDAVAAHRALGITLTKRNGQPMAGVPYHALEGYLRRLIEQGHRVAVCEQVQDPREAKGVVDRAVTRVVTPGTLVDESLLDEAAANQIAAVRFTEAGDQAGAVAAIVELSTGAFTLLDLPGDRVADELALLRPSELVYVETADGAAPPRVRAIAETIGCALTPRAAWTFRADEAREALLEHYRVTTLNGFGLDDDDPAVSPAGALLRYLYETQMPQDGAGGPSGAGGADAARPALAHIGAPRRHQPEQHVIIDAASLRSLEIERTMRSGSTEGSLLSVLQRCRTPMGKRLLRQWLCYPVRDLSRIERRQDCVATLLADAAFANELAKRLEPVHDLSRIVSRLSMGRATPRDLVALAGSVTATADLADLLDGVPAFAHHHRCLSDLLDDVAPIAQTIMQRCVDEPPAHLREGGLFRDGVDGELDEARSLQRDANTWLAAYQKRLIEQTEIPSLKVGYNKVFGYYIEITHAHRDKVPASFNRKQTLKNAERYITPQLKEFEDKVTTAEARAIERENALFARLCDEAARHASALLDYAERLAELDVLVCFADVARRYGYIRPRVVDAPVLDIRQGRHPVLDRTLGERFVPNDCALGVATREAAGLRREAGGQPAHASADAPGLSDADVSSSPGPTLALITGPNMAGKSTYIRQVALIVLLAHTGCFVPAESATIGLTDRIFTRIGASDELHAGQSTFMVEMVETANILHHATPRSLVILDEIGRGTSTLDGLSLAWAIAEAMAERGCRALFATHYHELTSLAERLGNVTNLHVAVREWGEEIIFLYRILPGRTGRSYGIHVAKIAGVPQDVINRASQLLDTLAVQTEPHEVPADLPAPPPGAQLGLFMEYVPHPVVDELKQVDLNRISPRDAFELLWRLCEQAGGRSDGEARG